MVQSLATFKSSLIYFCMILYMVKNKSLDTSWMFKNCVCKWFEHSDFIPFYLTKKIVWEWFFLSPELETMIMVVLLNFQKYIDYDLWMIIFFSVDFGIFSVYPCNIHMDVFSLKLTYLISRMLVEHILVLYSLVVKIKCIFFWLFLSNTMLSAKITCQHFPFL